MKKIVAMVAALCLALSCGSALAKGKVMLYSSMQEDQLMAVERAFEAAHPDIDMEYYYAGGGKLITKMATEAQAGQIEADVVWLGDPSDYESFKKAGYLQKYSSPETEHIDGAYSDADGYYTAGCLVTMTSPVALIDNCANLDNGKALIDFILSREGQEVLVANNLVTVRDDVEMTIDTSSIASINLPVDFGALAESIDADLAKFNEIFDK